jgi:hypothetical protein
MSALPSKADIQFSCFCANIAALMEGSKRNLGSRMGADGQAVRLRFVIKTMSAAVAHMAENLSSLSTFLHCDHLNTHRHCPLAREATDNLRAIDDLSDIGVFSRYFSN